ncbi:hypothetical protein [Heyndrickxia coagulans]|uniref:hypothetical protein n=1 Tax=Heyndrickxia coagulans TaxID=1398 RepID=UPI0012BBC2F3|nr:hypothetical protein [Heyndrickxia coagulans]
MENSKPSDLKLAGLPVKTPVSRNMRTQAFFIGLCDGDRDTTRSSSCLNEQNIAALLPAVKNRHRANWRSGLMENLSSTYIGNRFCSDLPKISSSCF